MNKLIYLASPYSENPEKNYKAVLSHVETHLRITGIVLFSPIVYGHGIAVSTCNEQINTDFESWKDFDLLMLSKSDELWVLKLDGWERSKGVKQEIEFAKNLGIKVRYIEHGN